jgi:hypothetical protein
MLAERKNRSAALACATSFQGHDLSPRRSLYHIFWQFFGNSKHPLAPAHLGPDFVGVNPGVNPEHHQIVNKIGAFPYNRFGLTVHRVDNHFDCFFGKLFGHLGAAGTQQAGRSRFRRVSAITAS